MVYVIDVPYTRHKRPGSLVAWLFVYYSIIDSGYRRWATSVFPISSVYGPQASDSLHCSKSGRRIFIFANAA